MAVRAVGTVMLLLFLVNKTMSYLYDDARATTGGRVALALKGAGRILLTSEQAVLYRQISAALEKNCKGFVTLPGMNSFYLWSGKDPPTGFNATWWVAMFSDELQWRVVSKLERIEGLCLLQNLMLVRFWTRGDLPFDGPLLQFMSHGFEPVATFGSYELLKRRESAE